MQTVTHIGKDVFYHDSEEYRVLQVTCRGESQIDEATPIYPAPQKAAEKKRLLLSNKVERFAVILFFIAYALTAKVKLRLAKAACKILWAFLFGNFFCGMG